MIDWACNYICI